MSRRERVEAVLRAAAFNGECWLSFRELVRRAGFAASERQALMHQIGRWERTGKLRIDRTLGWTRYRYALVTPGEWELTMTQFAVASAHGFEALTAPPQQKGEVRGE